MNDPEASLAVKTWWASRDALGGGGGGGTGGERVDPRLELGGSGPALCSGNLGS